MTRVRHQPSPSPADIKCQGTSKFFLPGQPISVPGHGTFSVGWRHCAGFGEFALKKKNKPTCSFFRVTCFFFLKESQIWFVPVIFLNEILFLFGQNQLSLDFWWTKGFYTKVKPNSNFHTIFCLKSEFPAKNSWFSLGFRVMFLYKRTISFVVFFPVWKNMNFCSAEKNQRYLLHDTFDFERGLFFVYCIWEIL